MDKTEFLDGLRQAGFRAVMMNGVPTVLSVDMSRDIPVIEKFVNNHDYHESFGIKKSLPESEEI